MAVSNVCLQVFSKLIRRYKYLEKAFEEEIKKVKASEYVVMSDIAANTISPYSPFSPLFSVSDCYYSLYRRQ